MIENTFASVDFLAVLLAATANFIVGGLWYSDLALGKNWAKEMELSPDDQEKNRSPVALVGAFVHALVSALFLAILIEATGWSGNIFVGAYLGLFVCVGFVVTSMATNFIFDRKSVELTWIIFRHHMLSFMVTGAVIGWLS